MRPEHDALADRDRVADLSSRIGVGFAQAKVAVANRESGQGGNLEARARRARYTALARLAEMHCCRFVATAHQGDDVLETLLMRLMRGTGVRGLAAIHPVRAMGESGIVLVRPMLGLDRAACEQICLASDWVWSEDATNQDETRLRSAVRARVVPILRELAPHVATQAVTVAQNARDAQAVVHAQALVLRPERSGERVSWERQPLREAHAAVLCEALSLGMRSLGVATPAREGPGTTMLRRIVRAIKDDRGDRREFFIAGITVYVEAVRVTIGVCAPRLP
jgi:tRNA(Ile)-lysidine synthase